MPAIRVEHLSKRYRLGLTHAGSIRELVGRFTDRLLGRRQELLAHELAKASGNVQQLDADGNFWALKDVSFDVPVGQALGIIGRNGAGKSTVLKLLSRVTAPTEGHVEINGRVASLLEVGTGFHPELTGRENVFLNGAILGMTKAEIRRKFDEIVAFSEIQEFVDTPVKRYSSGMYVRLAFAVAAHLDPEILIVDEVLAVGDAVFQKKCLGKMGDVAQQGRTVLFVSHNMQAIGALCNSALCLEGGRVSFLGPVREAIDQYLGKGDDTSAQAAETTWDLASAPGDSTTRLLAVRVVDEQGATAYYHDIAKPVTLQMEFALLRPVAELDCSFHVHNQQGMCLFAVGSPVTCGNAPAATAPGIYRSSCTIPANYLNDGVHRVSAIVVQDKIHWPARAEQVVAFCAHDYGADRGGYLGKVIGFIRPLLPWTSLRIGGLS